MKKLKNRKTNDVIEKWTIVVNREFKINKQTNKYRWLRRLSKVFNIISH